MKKFYWLKEIPTTLIDCINRYALATGTAQRAMYGANAEYNGHRVSIHKLVWGDWCASYIWSGNNVIARGEFQTCVDSAKRYYERGHKGASVKVTLYSGDTLSKEQIEILKKAGFEETDEEGVARYKEETFPQYDLQKEVPNAFWYRERFGSNFGPDLLLKSKNIAEYKVKVEEAMNARLNRR